MSPEAISLILVAAGLLVTLGGGFLAGLAWLVRRMDERFDKVDEQFSKVDEQFSQVHAKFNSLQAELNDVKVSVARLEGPQPRLICPR